MSTLFVVYFSCVLVFLFFVDALYICRSLDVTSLKNSRCELDKLIFITSIVFCMVMIEDE